MRYRRAFIPGGSFFFTLVTEKQRPLFASAEVAAVLREAFRTVHSTRPFELDAIVVLPDHLHCIWTLPPGDADFATRWRLIKPGSPNIAIRRYVPHRAAFKWGGRSRRYGSIVTGSICCGMKGISGYGAKDAPNSTYRTSPKLLSGALLSLDGGERFGDESDGDPGFDCRGAGDIGHQRLAVLLRNAQAGVGLFVCAIARTKP